MSNKTGSAKAICPYYITETGQSITCEGLIPGTDTMVRFETTERKKTYQRMHCEVYEYEHCCPMAEALTRKYEDEEE